MTDLSDVNMEGVKPMGDSQELGAGQYLVRIEETDKKQVNKEVFSEDGTKLTPNHYLQIDLKVYGGPSDGQVEFCRLNLWNHNATAVNIAKSELKSIQDAIGTVSTRSEDMHGKWLILEKKPKTKKPDELMRGYLAVPPEHYSSLKSFMDAAPPIAPKAGAAPIHAAVPASDPHAAPLPAYLRGAQPAAASAAATAPHATPSWGARK